MRLKLSSSVFSLLALISVLVPGSGVFDGSAAESVQRSWVVEPRESDGGSSTRMTFPAREVRRFVRAAAPGL